MAAVPLVTVNDFFENIKYQLDGVPEAVLITALITSEQILNPAWSGITLGEDDRNDVLRRLTGCTVATGTELNCYPRGFDDTLCFDLDGLPVP